MNSAYVLIIIITASALVDNHNVAIESAYFDSKEACEQAAKQIRGKEKAIGTYVYSADCYKKG